MMDFKSMVIVGHIIDPCPRFFFVLFSLRVIRLTAMAAGLLLRVPLRVRIRSHFLSKIPSPLLT